MEKRLLMGISNFSKKFFTVLGEFGKAASYALKN